MSGALTLDDQPVNPPASVKRPDSNQEALLDDVDNKEPTAEKPAVPSNPAPVASGNYQRVKTRHDRVFDTIRKGCGIQKLSIPGYHVSGNVVFYEVVVSNKKLRWNMWIRFDSFVLLHNLLKNLVDNLTKQPKKKVTLPPFPDKHPKILIDHFGEEFIENRRALLENYLQKILKQKYLKNFEDFVLFLMPPQDEKVALRDFDAAQPSSDSTKFENGDEAKAQIVKSASDDKLSLSEDEDDLKIDDHVESRSGTEDSHDDKPKGLSRTFPDMLFVSEKDEVTSVRIKRATVLKGQEQQHAIYHVQVRNTNLDEQYAVWTQMKRFNDFTDYDLKIRTFFADANPTALYRLPNLPPKHNKSWTDHLDKKFIEKRRVLLEVYLRRLIRYPQFRRHPITLAFLGVQDEMGPEDDGL